MREQPAAQVVDHPLAGVDLHLRAVGRHELVRRPAARTPAMTTTTSSANAVAAVNRPAASRRTAAGKRLPLEHVVDDDRQRPRLQRAERDLRRAAAPRAAPRARGTAAGTTASSGSRPSVALTLDLAGSRHPPTFRGGAAPAAAAPGSARCCGMISGTTLSSARVGDVEPAALRPEAANATRVGAPNASRPSSLRSRMMPSGPTARTWPL